MMPKLVSTSFHGYSVQLIAGNHLPTGPPGFINESEDVCECSMKSLFKNLESHHTTQNVTFIPNKYNMLLGDK